MKAMRLRPHHILDIVSGYGQGAEFRPHPYGHAQHTVAAAFLSDPELEIELVVGADEICRPCAHLGPGGRCDDVLRRLDPPVPKQTYNDGLDERLLDYLGLTAPIAMALRKYLEIANSHLPDLAGFCTHPGENREARLAGLRRGMEQLGVGGRRSQRLSPPPAQGKQSDIG
jgi:hypothetical protein